MSDHSIRRFLAVFTLSLALSPAATMAADANGDFAIKDAGAQTCGKFLAAWEAGSSDLAQYAGWISGYVTGLNQFTEGVYDAAPWQSTETLLGMTRSVCGQMAAETRFLDAFAALAQRMAPMRLAAQSPLEGVRRSGRAIVVYEAVLGAARRRLAEMGYEAGPEEADFDETTSDAFRAFQQARGIEETGLPDQKTLFELFMRSSETERP